MITGQELQDARNACRLTQDELASRLGVTSRTVVNWERQGVPKAKESLVRNMLQMSERGGSLADYSDLALLTELGRRLSALRGAENVPAGDSGDQLHVTPDLKQSDYTLAARRGHSIGKQLRSDSDDEGKLSEKEAEMLAQLMKDLPSARNEVPQEYLDDPGFDEVWQEYVSTRKVKK